MKVEILLLLPLAGLTVAGPARRDCGMTKSFVATNECGVAYGGTWIECATGVTDMPTFTAPPCPAIATSTANVTQTATAPDSLITPPPFYNTTSSPIVYNATSTCSPLWICVDLVVSCGGDMVPHGECYNTCTKDSPSTPACPTAAATGVPAYHRGSFNSSRVLPKLNFDKGPPREHKSWCDIRPWMCAPKGW